MPSALAMAGIADLLLGLPDLDRLRELLKRIQEILAMIGIAGALAASFIFLLTWVLSYLRRPSSKTSHPVLATAALIAGYLPVGLTLVAAVARFVPMLAPWYLQAFALAVILAAFTWCVAVAAIVRGGNRQNLARARRALLLAGTPWYCLTVYLSTYL